MIRNQNIPLYRQILDDIRTKLYEGTWDIGDMLPSDNELRAIYNVSSITIRRVIMELVNEGWIERRHGIGTFVKKGFVENVERPEGFFKEVRLRGKEPSAKVLFNDEVRITDTLLRDVPKLKVLKSERAFLIKKVHYVDSLPVEIVDSYWDTEVGRSIGSFDITARGLYEFVYNCFGVDMVCREQEWKAISASSLTATEFMIRPGVPVLRADRLLNGNDNSKIIEVAIHVYHPTNYRCRLVSIRASDAQNEQCFQLESI